MDSVILVATTFISVSGHIRQLQWQEDSEQGVLLQY